MTELAPSAVGPDELLQAIKRDPTAFIDVIRVAARIDPNTFAIVIRHAARINGEQWL